MSTKAVGVLRAHGFLISPGFALSRGPVYRPRLFLYHLKEKDHERRGPEYHQYNQDLRRVRHRQIFGILGPNGSGKSTPVRLVATLLIPDAGHITIFGHDVQQEEMQVKRTGKLKRSG